MKHGFLKSRCISPELRVADVSFNTAKIIQAVWESAENGAKLVVFPELCVTGATCGDLFRQNALLSASEGALEKIAVSTKGENVIAIVGAPIRNGNRVYNCAVAIANGKILGVTPKITLDATELRTFSLPNGETEIKIGESAYPFGNDLIFSFGEFKIGTMVGTDLFAPSISDRLCKMGACAIACPSAQIEIAGATERTELIARANSTSFACAYLISNACEDESTTDSLMCANNIICENGVVLAKSNPFEKKSGDIKTEIDFDLLSSVRAREFVLDTQKPSAREVEFKLTEEKTALSREINSTPFVAKENEREKYNEQILTIQSRALAKRLVASHSKGAVFGVSGGLDSTLALLVMVRACDYIGWKREQIYAITMPCFGTTSRTKSNAVRLSEALGVTLREINICDSVLAHFKDIGHDENLHNVTFENAQARERTQILMDISNQVGGLVVGTGDLSEIALGWSTYNADHMSMYNPNCDIPKTLVRSLVEHEARAYKEEGNEAGDILYDILGTEVSPELLPAKDDKITQKTEDILGPYEHHDFFLYNLVKYGFAPSKIYRLAKEAFKEANEDELYRHLELFIKRFFTQQFKRSCSPDGPKVTEVALSPRTDLKMPSDAGYWAFLDELETGKSY